MKNIFSFMLAMLAALPVVCAQPLPAPSQTQEITEWQVGAVAPDVIARFDDDGGLLSLARGTITFPYSTLYPMSFWPTDEGYYNNDNGDGTFTIGVYASGNIVTTPVTGFKIPAGSNTLKLTFKYKSTQSTSLHIYFVAAGNDDAPNGPSGGVVKDWIRLPASVGDEWATFEYDLLVDENNLPNRHPTMTAGASVYSDWTWGQYTMDWLRFDLGMPMDADDTNYPVTYPYEVTIKDFGVESVITDDTGLTGKLASSSTLPWLSATYLPYIKEIMIGEDVVLTDNAFNGATALENVIVFDTVPQAINSNVFGGINLTNVRLTVVDERFKEDYKAAPVWKDFYKAVYNVGKEPATDVVATLDRETGELVFTRAETPDPTFVYPNFDTSSSQATQKRAGLATTSTYSTATREAMMYTSTANNATGRPFWRTTSATYSNDTAKYTYTVSFDYFNNKDAAGFIDFRTNNNENYRVNLDLISRDTVSLVAEIPQTVAQYLNGSGRYIYFHPAANSSTEDTLFVRNFTINGIPKPTTGEIATFDSIAPWDQYKADIRTVTIGDGVNGIGELLAQLYIQLTQLENNNAELVSDTVRLYAQVLALQQANASLQSALDALEAQNAQLKTDTAALNATIAQLQAELAECQAQSIHSPAGTASFSVYPNPTNSLVYFDNLQNEEVKVFNMQGKLVYSNRVDKIDFSAYTAGTYILRVGDKVGKVVKE